VSSTIEFESYLPKYQPVRAVNEASLEQSTTMTPRAQAVNEQSLLQHLLNRIEKLEITQPQHEAQKPRSQQRPLRQPRQRGVPRREVVCYQCGMPGHYA